MNRPLTRTVRRAVALSACLAALAGARTAGAQGAWTDWTAATAGAPGSASGVLTFGTTEVLVGYLGEVRSAQTSCGTNFWTTPSTYDAPGIAAPPDCDIVTLVGGRGLTNTVTFSRPVRDPFMAILSLGQGSVPTSYDFDAPFSVVSSGPGFYGNGTLVEAAGNRVEGREGHGTIQFQGTFTSISWTVPVAENWHGFTMGAAGLADVSAVPEPATVTLLAIGLAGLGLVARKRAKKA